MFLTQAGYLALQWLRPNLNISLSESSAFQLSHALDPVRFSHFMVELFVRLTTLFDAYHSLLANSYAVTFLLLVGLALWFWWGGRAARLGLLWFGLHAAFIYAALWLARPDFFSGRHLYNALIGVTLAVGAVINGERRRTNDERRRTNDEGRTTKVGPRSLVIGHWSLVIGHWSLVLILALLLVYQAGLLRRLQNQWLVTAERDRAARQQMRQLLPELTPRTRLFAYRFVIQPSYLPAAARVWYDQPVGAPGGSLEQLRQQGAATADFYLFDYENGRLTNLMPELQQHRYTRFLWSQTPLVTIGDDRQAVILNGREWPETVVAGPPADRRLALQMPLPALNGRWLSLAYTVDAPPGSELRLAARTPPNAGAIHYRARLTANDESIILWQQSEQFPDDGWRDLALSLEPYWGQSVTIHLELQAGDNPIADNAYWSNPRLVIDY